MTRLALRWRPLWLALGWLMVAGVVYLSLMPSPPEPIRFALSDKLEHAAGFAWLALWFLQIVVVSRRFAVAAVLLLLGVAIEIAQSFTATRLFEAADIAADGAGVLAGAWLVRGRLGGMLIGFEKLLGPGTAGS